MAGLPKDYASRGASVAGGAEGAPPLGPRLPGDLGRPILNAGAPSPVIGAADQPGTATDGATTAQTPLSSSAFRRASAWVTRGRRRRSASCSQAPRRVQLSLRPPHRSRPCQLLRRRQRSQLSKATRIAKLVFLNGSVDRQTLGSERLEAASSRNIIQAGAVIAAALPACVQIFPGRSPPR